MTAALISGADAKEDMVERVARAHYTRTIEIVTVTRPGNPFLAWEELPEEQRRIALAGARAAIAAMREPTEAMCAAAEATGDHWYFDDSWAAMIDAALQEGK